MADIDIEKRPTTFWPWVAGIGVLALVVISLMVLLGRAEEPGAEPAAGATAHPQAGSNEPPADAPQTFAPPTGGAVSDPVAAYRAATDNLTPEAAADPGRLEPLLDALATAIGVVAEAAPERAATLRARADSARMGDWRLPRQTLLVRSAFEDAAAVLGAAAERGIGGVHPTAAREVGIAAGHVTPDRPLDTQGAEIVAFLQRVTRAFEGMR